MCMQESMHNKALQLNWKYLTGPVNCSVKYLLPNVLTVMSTKTSTHCNPFCDFVFNYKCVDTSESWPPFLIIFCFLSTFVKWFFSLSTIFSGQQHGNLPNHLNSHTHTIFKVHYTSSQFKMMRFLFHACQYKNSEALSEWGRQRFWEDRK